MLEPLIDIEDTRLYLIEDDVDVTDATLLAALNQASALIRSEAGTDFAPVELDEDEDPVPVTETLEGTVSRIIYTGHFPVADVSEVSYWYRPYNTDATVLDVEDYSWDDTGRILRVDGYGWGGPYSIVTVTYTYGYTEVPADIQAVCVAMTKRMIVYGSRYSDGQVQDPGATVSVGLTPLERRVISRYRIPVVV